MFLQKIGLTNFRSYDKREFQFEMKSLVEGDNGAGKSNLIEAIYLLATGRSYRADKEDEMVRYGVKISIINYQFSVSEQKTDAKITLTDGSGTYGRKKFELNGVPKRQMDFVGKFRAVLFGPSDMELITGSPSIRRRYLDFVLTQTDREYRRSLISYEKGLRQRNKLLDLIKEELASRSQLFFWDRLLIKEGNYLTDKRREYINRLNCQKEQNYRVTYDKSEISEMRLKQYEVEEVAAGATLVGPHRDDFMVQTITDMGEKDVSKYGSRGQQRMAVLWLKTGERDWLTMEDELPVLLLDDIFSELDEKHRQEVLKMVDNQVSRGGQVIMTSAENLQEPQLENWQHLHL